MAAYAAWVYLGYNFSKNVADVGGVYNFVERAGLRKAATAVGWLYWVAYFLYMPSMLAYMSSVLLPAIGLQLPCAISALAVAAAVSALMLSGVRPPLYYVLAASLAEVALIVAIGLYILPRVGPTPFLPKASSTDLAHFAEGAFVVGYTVAGGGAGFFLGREAKGGASAVASAYLAAFLTAAVAVSFAAYYETASARLLGGVSSLAATGYPLYYITDFVMGQWTALLIAVMTANSLVASVVAVYGALARLTHALTGRPPRRALALIATPLMILSPLLTTNYSDGITASLVAPFGAHAFLALIYPKFKREIGDLHLFEYIIVLFVIILFIYGIYLNI